MLRAVLFDWGDTLSRASWDEEIARNGTTAALATLAEREDLPDVEAVLAWWARPGQPFSDHRHEDEIDFHELQRTCFAELGVTLGDDEIARYTAALHGAWHRTEALGAHAHALLEALRARGLKLGIVSNISIPAHLIRTTLEEQGLTQRVDSVVLSCEVGKRKPHAAIYERALEELDVDAHDALFVGDRRYHDVYGASRLGMKTVQALWFRADDDAEGTDPDYEAFTFFDVLNIADRLLRR